MANKQPENEKQFSIQKIHLKDVSLEAPNSPSIFTEKWDPKVEINLSSNAQPMQNNLFEVSLTATITVKIQDKTAYLVEVCQAGIFSISGLLFISERSCSRFWLKCRKSSNFTSFQKSIDSHLNTSQLSAFLGSNKRIGDTFSTHSAGSANTMYVVITELWDVVINDV